MTTVAAVDLFCGAGGLTYGLERAGIPVAAGIDVDRTCEYPYEKNTEARFVEADVGEFDGDDLKELYPDDCTFKALVGCAPCQPFSHMSNGHTDEDAREWDLLDDFARLVKEVKPDLVAMENVPQVQKHDVYSRFRTTLDGAGRPEERGLGYYVWADTIDCPQYGVPQSRRRLVLLASQFGEIELVPPSYEPDDPSDPVTVRRTLQPLDLPEIDAGERAASDPLHVAADLRGKNPERMRQSKPGGTWEDWDPDLRAKCHEEESGDSYVSSYGRMEWDAVAPTITTQFYNYGSGRFGHPEWTENPEESVDRALSLREGALLQTHPPEYVFSENPADISKNKIGRLVGNAVPVRLAGAIGGSIRRHFEQLELALDTWPTYHSDTQVPPSTGSRGDHPEILPFLVEDLESTTERNVDTDKEFVAT